MNHLFCFGYGYSAHYLGEALKKNNEQWRLSGTTRDKNRARALKQKSVNVHEFKRQTPLLDATSTLKSVTHLLISTPPDDDGDPAYLSHAIDIAKMPALKWVGYLSTTGIYGDRGGRWVNEKSGVTPTSRRGSRRAKAEEQWLSLHKTANLPVHIFRLAGIYGPNRSALDSVQAGIARRIYKPDHSFGRIHVEDIARILIQSFHSPAPGNIYNVCDDLPAPSHLVIEHACTLLNITPPPLIPFEDANLAPMTRSFYSENRRVRNDKIKCDLGVELKYKDYKLGLKGCLDAMRTRHGMSDQEQARFEETPQTPAIFTTQRTEA